MWETRSIERTLKEHLTQSYSESEADNFWGEYVGMRRALDEQVFSEIKAVEPSLTKHDASHVGNVLDNIEKLLGEEIKKISAMDLYILCICVLFHDAGNISGRKRHNQVISKVYDSIKENAVLTRPEQAIITRVAGAHTGKSKDGSQDSLKDVPSELPLRGTKIQAQRLAAVLRFADELAEGPQRTSWYMLEQGSYEEGSELHHVHGSCLDLCIDRGSGRIALTYDFNISIGDDLCVSHRTSSYKTPLKNLLEFTYMRILKLDLERKYTKHYCDWLAPFKEVSVTLRFWGGKELDLGLQPLILSDLIIPGDKTKEIRDLDENYATSQLIDKVREATQTR